MAKKKKKQEIPLPIGTEVWAIRENLSCGMNMINPPEPYKTCEYQIVKGKVTNAYQYHSPRLETGFRAVFEKAGPSNLGNYRKSDIGRSVFTSYEEAEKAADHAADKFDESFWGLKMYGKTYRPWKEQNDETN